MSQGEEKVLSNIEFLLQDEKLLKTIKANGNILWGNVKELVRKLVFSEVSDKTLQPVCSDSLLTVYYDDETDKVTLEFIKAETSEILLELTGSSPEDIMANVPDNFIVEVE